MVSIFEQYANRGWFGLSKTIILSSILQIDATINSKKTCGACKT